MKLTYNTIFTRCQDISSYEGGRISDADGNSMYPAVHLTEQDKPLLIEYVTQSANLISKAIGYGLEDTAYASDGVEFTFLADERLRADGTDVSKSIESVIVSYVMWQWLSDKSAERSKAWSEIYAEMMRLLPKSVKKRRPTLDENY